MTSNTTLPAYALMHKVKFIDATWKTTTCPIRWHQSILPVGTEYKGFQTRTHGYVFLLEAVDGHRIYRLQQEINKMILHTPHYPVDKSIPGFSIYRNHKRIESIQVYWIEKAFLDIPKALSGVCLINFPNGGYFKRVYDNVQLPEDATITKIPVVISFQVHSYGYFAVIRNDETIVKQESKQ